MTHPFRDCGVWEFDDEHPDGWPVCADCGEAMEGHDGFIPLGAMSTDGLPYDEGTGYLPKQTRYLVHPDECIVTGRPLRCARPDHPTAASNCATGEES